MWSLRSRRRSRNPMSSIATPCKYWHSHSVSRMLDGRRTPVKNLKKPFRFDIFRKNSNPSCDPILKARRGSLKTTDKERTGRLRALPLSYSGIDPEAGFEPATTSLGAITQFIDPSKGEYGQEGSWSFSQSPGSRGLNPLIPFKDLPIIQLVGPSKA